MLLFAFNYDYVGSSASLTDLQSTIMYRICTSLFTGNGIANNEKQEKNTQKQTKILCPDQTSHTAETTDQIVFSLCKLFTWYLEVEH